MKRYHFPLAPVMRARRAQEQLARERLVAARLQVAAAHEAHQAVLVEYRASVGRAPGVLDRSEFLAQRSAADFLAGRVERATQALVAAEARLSERRCEWEDVARSLAALERLEERRLHEWRAAVAREEGLAVDDMVAARRLAAANPGRSAGAGQGRSAAAGGPEATAGSAAIGSGGLR